MAEADLEFGAFVPRWDQYSTPEGWRRVAQASESAGFAWVGRGDRVVYPADPDDTNHRPAADLFSVLATVICETDSIQVGTNVCVAPYRHPVDLLTEIMTLDVLSNGRFEFGVGAGWFEGEFDALGVSYEERGARTNEFLEIFDAARHNDVISYDGEHYAFDPISVHPGPVTPGGPPLWLGGSSSAAFRRTAEHDGVGWVISGSSPDEVRTDRERLLRAWNDYDRTGEPRVGVNVNAYLSEQHAGNDTPLVGTRDEVLEGISAYREAGVDRINLTLSTTPSGDRMSIDERVDQIERFGAEIMPRI